MRSWLNRTRQQRLVRPHRRIGKVWFIGRPSMMLGAGIARLPGFDTVSLRDDTLSWQTPWGQPVPDFVSLMCVTPATHLATCGWDFPRSFIIVFRLAAVQLCRIAATQIAEFDSGEVWGWEVRKRRGIMMPKVAIGVAAAAMAVSSALGASAHYGSGSVGHYKSGIVSKRSEDVKHAALQLIESFETFFRQWLAAPDAAAGRW
jgi:hypothetical protein